MPRLDDDVDVLGAALAYAKAGWYVLALEPAEKLPDRQLYGKRWQEQSSRDPKEIVSWFAGTDRALGLHVGRSGAVAFDLDDPDETPDVLAKAVEDCAPPFQSTREEGRRGHVVFATPPGRTLGNSRGKLRDRSDGVGRSWGEVRGANGIIAVQPSQHAKPGGRYRWETTGAVPLLPDYVAEMLPDSTLADYAVSASAMESFFAEHDGATKPQMLEPVLRKFAEEAAGSSRHEALVRAACWAMREARAGLYPAREAADKLTEAFVTLMGDERFPASEAHNVLAWAIAQALQTPAPREDQPAPPGPPAQAVVQRRHPEDYFDKTGFDAALLADDVLAAGPLAVGRDGRFWAYNGGVWTEAGTIVRNRLVDLLGSRYRPGITTTVEHVVDRRIERIQCDPTPGHVNFLNGMLDWRTGELLPHDPSWHSTVQLPVEWNPAASCEEFSGFLASILTPAYVDLAWEMIGYLMMSGNPLQVAFLYLGRGQNGKGTLIRLMGRLLGLHNVSTASLDRLSTNRFASAGLYGKIANLAGDIDPTHQEKTATFKALTGEDTIDAEHKGTNPFSFQSWAVPVFSANKIPTTSDTSKGYFRRWVVLPFDRTIAEADRIRGLDGLLAAELPGIAARAIPALRVLMARGGFDTTDPEVASTHAEFVRRSDQIQQFVDECSVFEPEHVEHRQQVFEAYKAWAKAGHYGLLNAGHFYDRLENVEGLALVKRGGKRMVKGLKLLDEHRWVTAGVDEPVLSDPFASLH